MQLFTQNKKTTLLFALAAGFLATNEMLAQDVQKTLITMQGEKLKTVSSLIPAPAAKDIASTLYVDLMIKQSLAGFTNSLASGNIFVGNTGGVAAEVTMSGDATIVASGALTLNNLAVIGQQLTGFAPTSGTITATNSIKEAIEILDYNIASAATGIDVDNTTTTLGNAPALGIDKTTDPKVPVIKLDIPNAGFGTNVVAGLISNADYVKFDSKLSSLLTTNQIFVGNNDVAEAVDMIGEATIVAGGSITLNNDAVIAKTLTGFDALVVTGEVTKDDDIVTGIKKLQEILKGHAMLEHMTERKVVTIANTTSFTIPNVNVYKLLAVFINGQKVFTDSFTNANNVVTYNSATNGDYGLSVDDVVSFQFMGNTTP